MLSRSLANFFEFFTLMKYVENTSWGLYKLVLQLGMIFLLVILLNIIFVSMTAKKKIGGLSVSVQVLKVLIWILSSVLY